MARPPIVIETDTALPPWQHRAEIVERKGRGHPDSICDAVAEAVAVALLRAYRDTFGFVPHFNVDKAMLVAGRADHRLGGGAVLEPARFVIGDRATGEIAGRRLDVAAIAEASAKQWLRSNLAHADPERHFRYQVELRPGSPELTRIMAAEGQSPVANDTSVAVGFAPLSETEVLVLDVERYLNGPAFKTRFPLTGEDVKVMAVRIGRRLALTVAMPLLDRYIATERAYFDAKAAIVDDLLGFVADRTGALETTVALNTLDDPGRGLAGMYLSVTGTSAEDGDSGEVGRGNAVNGLISVMRPGSAEAAAGKNPICHVGKIYNVLAHQMARRIDRELEEVEHVSVWLCSQIGAPLDRPQLCSVQVRPATGASIADVAGPVEALVEQELDAVGRLCEELARGEHPVC